MLQDLKEQKRDLEEVKGGGLNGNRFFDGKNGARLSIIGNAYSVDSRVYPC